MKFISKSTNLLIVLRAGLQAQPLSGQPAKPTVSVRFKDGVADVPDGELSEMMLAHPAFNSDFIATDDTGGRNPYEASRIESEPAHIVTEMKFGTPVKSGVHGGKTKLSPEIQKVVEQAAAAMAKEMLPAMLQSALKGLVEAHVADKKTAVKSTTKRKGRPRGKKIAVKKQNPKIQEPSISKSPISKESLVPASIV